jgi:hypothetical protein
MRPTSTLRDRSARSVSIACDLGTNARRVYWKRSRTAFITRTGDGASPRRSAT